jgi:hypothetical protein
MNHPSVKKNNSLKIAILISLLAMLILIVAWHLALPLLGISIAVTGAIWGVAIATVVLLCIATLLFFIFTGFGIFIIGFFVFAWTLGAIILFPLLFPLLLPILLVMIFIAMMSRES